MLRAYLCSFFLSCCEGTDVPFIPLQAQGEHYIQVHVPFFETGQVEV